MEQFSFSLHIFRQGIYAVTSRQYIKKLPETIAVSGSFFVTNGNLKGLETVERWFLLGFLLVNNHLTYIPLQRSSRRSAFTLGYLTAVSGTSPLNRSQSPSFLRKTWVAVPQAF